MPVRLQGRQPGAAAARISRQVALAPATPSLAGHVLCCAVLRCAVLHLLARCKAIAIQVRLQSLTLAPLGSSAPPSLQRLAALTADAAAAEAYLAPRHVVDVLRDFALPAGAALGPAELLGTLRQLQPRLYSISSSQVGSCGGLQTLHVLCPVPRCARACVRACAAALPGMQDRSSPSLCIHLRPCVPLLSVQLEHPTRVQATVAIVRCACLPPRLLRGWCRRQHGAARSCRCWVLQARHVLYTLPAFHVPQLRVPGHGLSGHSISLSLPLLSTAVHLLLLCRSYESLGAGRVGVCSTYLGERLQQGQEVPVYIHKNPDFRQGAV